MSRFYGGRAPYVPVAKRRAQAQRKLEALRKKGRICLPVVIEGRAIAKTFWGKKWCDNLEAYSDYANRLERGRTYVRNGSVVDLQIAAGQITALVSGSEMYEVSIGVNDLETSLWQSILAECAGKVASLVELLQGRLSSAVMEVVARHGSGLFPVPKHIKFRCSCPDTASMCKHVAAILYGVGARLDSQPELLFLLRRVDPLELIKQAGSMSIADVKTTAGQHQQLDTSDLSSLFGIELNEPQLAPFLTSAAARIPVVTSNRPGLVKQTPKSRTDTPKSAAHPKPAANKAASPRRKPSSTVTPTDLIARGVPRHMQQSWLESGVLLRTEERGVYGTTKQTEVRIEDYINSKRMVKAK